METNVKVVGFANQSVNGVTVANQGFDMEYDGQKMNISGFSGDKLYYAKLNNQQLANLLNMPSSDIPLEKRILLYKKAKKHTKKANKKTNTKSKKTKTKSKTRKSIKKSGKNK